MLNFTFDKRINMDQATNSILMIRPINFGYNEETAGDNHYQNKDSIIKNIKNVQKTSICVINKKTQRTS